MILRKRKACVYWTAYSSPSKIYRIFDGFLKRMALISATIIIIAIALQFFPVGKSILSDTAIIHRTALGENIQVHFRFRLCFHDRGRVKTSEAGLHPFDRLRAKERGLDFAQRDDF